MRLNRDMLPRGANDPRLWDGGSSEFQLVQAIGALEGHGALLELDLSSTADGDDWTQINANECQALAYLLKNPVSKLMCLDLSRNSIGGDCMPILSPALMANNSIRKLNLNGCNLRDGDLVVLANALANNSSLKDLDLGAQFHVTPLGWKTFFKLMMSSEAALETLDLGADPLLHLRPIRIDDGGAVALVEWLTRRNTIRSLRLEGSLGLTTVGYHAFTTLLQLPESKLSTLVLDRASKIRDQDMVSFSNALAHNTSLKELIFGHQRVGNEGWNALTRVLCDASSPDKTYASNHTLCRVANTIYIPAGVRASLEMNANPNKAEVVRRKFLRHCFSGITPNMSVFVNMDWKCMPHVVAWIGRDELGLAFMNHLVRSLPSLVDKNREDDEGNRGNVENRGNECDDVACMSGAGSGSSNDSCDGDGGDDDYDDGSDYVYNDDDDEYFYDDEGSDSGGAGDG